MNPIVEEEHEGRSGLDLRLWRRFLRFLGPYRRPIAVLCNQNSFSNAEIFAHAVETLGRGQLVGVQVEACPHLHRSIGQADGGKKGESPAGDINLYFNGICVDTEDRSAYDF